MGFELKGKYGVGKVYAETIDDVTTGQIVAMLNAPMCENTTLRIMPDAHFGKGSTVGTSIQYNGEIEKIVPNVVGVDVGCAILEYKLPITEITTKELEKLDEVIRKYVPSGSSRHDTEKIDSLDGDLRMPITEKALKNVYRSVGTLGGGNHYIELGQSDVDNSLWLSVHSGSRSLGVLVCQYYQNLANQNIKDLLKSDIQNSKIDLLLSHGDLKNMESNLKVIKAKYNMPEELSYLTGDLVGDYLHDMEIAQKYSTRNRKAMLDVIVKQMGWAVADSFESMHNYIDTKTKTLRKGATDASEGLRLVIPLNSRDGALICVGKGSNDWNNSAPHGAGRILSRSKAKHDLDLETYKKDMADVFTTSVTQNTLDESPRAYKNADEIKRLITDTVEILHVLKPVYNFKANEKPRVYSKKAKENNSEKPK